jgi:hypothetical protein
MLTVIIQRALKYSLKTILKAQQKHSISSEANFYYFGYGANLGIDRFEKLHIKAEIVGVARLNNFKLVFDLPCEYKGKGFAGIEESKNDIVLGTLFKLNREVLLLLDVVEWVPFKFYKRIKVSVIQDNQLIENVFVYKTVYPTKDLTPSTGYLNYIKEMARKNNFPQSYLDYLDSISSNDQFQFDHGFCLHNPSKRRPFETPLKNLYQKHDILREKLTKIIP